MNNLPKILFVTVILIIFIGLIIASTSFFYEKKAINSQLSQAKQLITKIQSELTNLQADKDKTLEENEKLQADAVSYLAINTKLQEEKDKLQKILDETQQVINTKEGSAQRAKLELGRLEKKITKEKEKQYKELVKQKEDLQKKIAMLESSIQKERTLYNYNLGVAYVQAGLYDDAIEAYEKSLKFDNNNPDAQYNLGLIYKNFKDDPEIARQHFLKYLELKPDAQDKDEVEGWIKAAAK